MIDDLNIGIIGAGNMGSAIIRGIITGYSNNKVMANDIDKSKLNLLQTETGIKIAESIDEVAHFSDLLVLAVKPDITIKIAAKLKNFSGIIISIAAGVSINTIKANAGEDKKIVRAMPNAPVNVKSGMTVMSHTGNLSSNEVDIVKSFFSTVGEVLVMDEKYINAVTAISGSGPAYVFTFLQAMADGGVKLGIPRTEALVLASQTILGSIKIFIDKNENPFTLRDKITSPGGTTIEALHVLEKAGFSGIIMDAIEAAAKKSKELDNL
ncbi:MAG: pyrroline-5-carboxylate reductase [Spirochaetes bacterium]|nr:pyrroline-5-carboxylate reductase [Spirochaetota bacterium]